SEEFVSAIEPKYNKQKTASTPTVTQTVSRKADNQQPTSPPTVTQTVLRNDTQFTLVNPNPEIVTFEQVDRVIMKANLKSKTNTAIGINPVINDGIYLLEFKYENIVANMPQGPGIVKASYVIPKECEPWENKSTEVTQNMICLDTRGGEVMYKGQGKRGNPPYRCGQKIGMELDMGKKTLHFFFDDKQLPIYVSGINEPVRFFVHMREKGESFTILSFQHLTGTISKSVPMEKAVDF
ncbi:MAG: hypothetical protein EZS28_029027, partial [Streblomastix strix]